MLAQQENSLLSVCPLNFVKFEKLMALTGDAEASLLLAKINFHMRNTKLEKSGLRWIARKRDQIAEWFNFSTKKVDRLLKILEKKGLIHKKIGMYYGEKRVFISSKIHEAPLNDLLLEELVSQTGSIKSALVYAKIAFAQNNSTIELNSKKCTAFKRESLARWIGVSIRTIDSILGELVKKGLISKQLNLYNGKNRAHLHVTSPSVEAITHNKEKNLDSKSQICSAKKGFSIKETLYRKKVSNNTSGKIFTRMKNNLAKKQKSDVAFVQEEVNQELSQAQLAYLTGAIRNTINRFNTRLSNPVEFFEQVKFSITSNLQHKGVSSFKHRVNRCMKLLSSGNWKTPIGFKTHSPYGVLTEQKRKEQECMHRLEKQREISEAITLTKSLVRNCALTDKAIEISKRIIKLSQMKALSKSDRLLLDTLVDQLKQNLNNGADYQQVREMLEKGRKIYE